MLIYLQTYISIVVFICVDLKQNVVFPITRRGG